MKFWITELKRIIAEEARPVILEFLDVGRVSGVAPEMLATKYEKTKNKDLMDQFGHDFLALAASKMRVVNQYDQERISKKIEDLGGNDLYDQRIDVTNNKNKDLVDTKSPSEIYIGFLEPSTDPENPNLVVPNVERGQNQELEPGFYVLKNLGLKTQFRDSIDNMPTENDMVAFFGVFRSVDEALRYYRGYKLNKDRISPHGSATSNQ